MEGGESAPHVRRSKRSNLYRGPWQAQKYKRRPRPPIKPEGFNVFAAGIAGEGAEPADVHIGGLNGACTVVHVFSGHLRHNLALFLRAREAAGLRQLCKAFYFGGTDPLASVVSVSLTTRPLFRRLQRLGPVRHLHLHGNHHSDRRLQFYAQRFGPSLETIVEETHVNEDCKYGNEHSDLLRNVLPACPLLQKIDILGQRGSMAPHIEADRWQHLTRLHLRQLNGTEWIGVLCALTAPTCHRLTQLTHLGLERRDEARYSTVNIPHWSRALLGALVSGRFANLESWTLSVPPASAQDDLNPKEVIRQGVTSANLPRLRQLEIVPWPSSNDLEAWTDVWAAMWRALDRTPLQVIKVKDMGYRAAEPSARTHTPPLSDPPYSLHRRQINPTSGIDHLIDAVKLGYLSNLVEFNCRSLLTCVGRDSKRLSEALLAGHCPSLRTLEIEAAEYDTEAGEALVACCGALAKLSLTSAVHQSTRSRFTYTVRAKLVQTSWPISSTHDRCTFTHMASLNLRWLCLSPDSLRALCLRLKGTVLQSLTLSIDARSAARSPPFSGQKDDKNDLICFQPLLDNDDMPALTSFAVYVRWGNVLESYAKALHGALETAVAHACCVEMGWGSKRVWDVQMEG